MLAVRNLASPAGTATLARCRICGSVRLGPAVTATEMMIGLRETFDYVPCLECGTLQIAAIPDDLGRYYGEGYYSFSAQPEAAPTGVAALARRWRNAYAVFGRGLAGRLLYRLRPEPSLTIFRAIPGMRHQMRILDVGCGSQALTLRKLDHLGFQHLLGADPFLPADERVSPRLELKRLGIDDLSGAWDLVMLNHSFEHVPDPNHALERLARLLAPGGTLMLRIPTVSSAAWKLYGADWCQLDAPRHLHLLSRPAVGLLAARHGLEVYRLVDDSTALQFFGSESIRQGVPLTLRHPVAPEKMAEWEASARELNAAGEGDQFAALLRQVDEA